MTAEVISIGVAAPSARYGQHLAPASSFVDDALDHLRAIAGAVDGRLTERRGSAATCAQVTADLRDAAHRLASTPAGLMVLSFAGHGGQRTDTSGDEADGRDEGWALDDQPLIDDILATLLAEFHRDVHVVVISNCCFSGGMFDGAAWRASTPPPSAAGSLPRTADRLRLLGRAGELDLACPRTATSPSVLTNRVIIASCSDQQGTVLTSESRLTDRLLATMFPIDDGRRVRRPLDYHALELALVGMGTTTQMPVVLTSPLDKERAAFVPQPLVRG